MLKPCFLDVMKSTDLPINEEVSRLLKFAHTNKAEGRSDLFTVIVDFLERRHAELTKNQLSLMSDILVKLISDVEIAIRQKLVGRLAEDDTAPIDLIILLANDQIEVARPVLSLSTLLSDEDLIEIIRHKTVQHQLAITSRRRLSPKICHELITVGNSKTLVMLLNNPQARIDQESFSTLVEKSRNDRHIQPPLIERPDLPANLAARMYQWVSDSLKQAILTNFHLNEADIERLVATAVTEATIEHEARITQEGSEILLVNKLHKAGRLTPSFLMKCLRQGQSSLFEIAFSKIILVPQKLMRSLLYDGDTKTLAVICCAADIDRSVFMTIYQLTRRAQNLDPELSNEEIADALEYYRKLDKQTALVTIQQWVRETPQRPFP